MPIVTVMTDDDAMYQKAEQSLQDSGLEVRRTPQLRVECPQNDIAGRKRQEPLRQQMLDFLIRFEQGDVLIIDCEQERLPRIGLWRVSLRHDSTVNFDDLFRFAIIAIVPPIPEEEQDYLIGIFWSPAEMYLTLPYNPEELKVFVRRLSTPAFEDDQGSISL